MQMKISSLKRKLKFYKWWNYKVPPLLAIAYYLIAINDPSSPLETLLTIGVFLVAVVGIAGFGHLVNDLFDMEQDQIVGKHNVMQRLTTVQRRLLFLLLLVVSALPWFYLPTDWLNLALVGLQLLLLIAYSLPPIRLKERGLWGVLADALYGHTVPILITFTTFSQLGNNMRPIAWLLPSLCLWSLCAGIRGILYHQALDVENDEKSGITTFATQHGDDKTGWLLSRVLIPTEMAFFIVIGVIFSFEVSLFLIGFMIYVLWRFFQVKYMWEEDLDPFDLTTGPFIRFYGYVLLNEFYEKWLPIFILAALIIKAPIYALLAILHLVLFKNGLSEFLLTDLRCIPFGIENMRKRPV